MHLANYAVNKKPATTAECGAENVAAHPPAGIKWSFAQYSRHVLQAIQRDERLMSSGRKAWAASRGEEGLSPPSSVVATELVNRLWHAIHMVCVKSVLAAQHAIAPLMRFAETSLSNAPLLPEQLSAAKPQLGPCFELLGFDIMVDDDLKPWLIEINHSPSWFTETTFDFELKRRVIRDAAYLTLMPHIKRQLRSADPARYQRRGLARASSVGSTHPDDDMAAERMFYAQEFEAEGNGFVLVAPKKSSYDELKPAMDFQSCWD
jgi:hypothetical protein